MPIARLADRAVLQVSGPDAKNFLQGLVTNDVERVMPGRAIYAALLAPQGKILFDFLIAERDGAFLLDASAGQSEELLKRLRMYKLRAPIELALRPDLAVFAIWEKSGALEQPGEWTSFRDPRLPALGWRVIAPSDHPFLTANAKGDSGAYADHRLALGVPDSADVVGEFLLDANGEELNGVDFRKGCYVGQEVTARMKHKAQPRRRLVPVVVDGDTLPPGTKLVDDTGREIGKFAGGQGSRAMASVRLDRLKDATALSAGGRHARIESAAYSLPETPPG